MSMVALAAGAAAAGSTMAGNAAALAAPEEKTIEDEPGIAPDTGEAIPWERRRKMMLEAYAAFAPKQEGE